MKNVDNFTGNSFSENVTMTIITIGIPLLPSPQKKLSQHKHLCNVSDKELFATFSRYISWEDVISLRRYIASYKNSLAHTHNTGGQNKSLKINHNYVGSANFANPIQVILITKNGKFSHSWHHLCTTENNKYISLEMQIYLLENYESFPTNTA